MSYLYAKLDEFWTSDEEKEDKEETTEKTDEEKSTKNEKLEKREYDPDHPLHVEDIDAHCNSETKERINFKKEFLNNRIEGIDNFALENILQKYDVNDLMYNDSLLTFYDHGIEITGVPISDEKPDLNENYNIEDKSFINYVEAPFEGLNTAQAKSRITIKKVKEGGGGGGEEEEEEEHKEEKQNKNEVEIKKDTIEKETINQSNVPKQEMLICKVEEPEKKEEINQNDKGNARVNAKTKFIRKKWVIEDNHSDVSNFSKDDLLLNYNFELDVFQKRSIMHLNNFKHVFVAAHTSAGKTLIAEHAIALSIKLQKKAIYTSPIKALSNQKYNEFKNIFKDVGIITGDIKINVNSNCLIMTTEILRNLIYINDNIINNIHCVIFDEVHYVNDEDRGVIWEETIIMLPDHVQILLLSATVPNYLEFADWIGFTKKKEIIAIATKTRPVPLLHYIYAFDSIHLVMDEKNKFYATAFKELYSKIRKKSESAKNAKQLPYKKRNSYDNKRREGSRGGGGSSYGGKSYNKGNDRSNTGNNKQNHTNNNDNKQTESTKKSKMKPVYTDPNIKTETQKLQILIQKLEQDNKLPVVLFCFSRNKCEMYGKHMPHLNFLNSSERSRVHVLIKESLSNLNERDRDLNQIRELKKILEKGIGIHHGGLLPILKEVVEILFSKGLLKVLFATETFAMGINMPTKSVVFTSIYKHDHSKKRLLTSSEYTQMSGRAGRRSSDKFGYVYIFCCSNIPDQVQLTEMMTQKAVSLKSKFKITFNMILKLLMNRRINLEQMMFSSFLESCRALQLPLFKRDLTRKRKILQDIEEVDCMYVQYPERAPIERYVNEDVRLRYIGFDLHERLYNMKSDAFVIGRVMLLNDIKILHSSVYAIYLGTDRSIANQHMKTDFAKYSIFFQNEKKNEPKESFMFLIVLPSLMTYDELMKHLNEEELEHIVPQAPTESTNARTKEGQGTENNQNETNAENNTKQEEKNEDANILSEKVNLYENHYHVFAKRKNPMEKKIIHHDCFDSNMNKKHFVVCTNIHLENISVITNTVIQLNYVKPTSVRNNTKSLLLYAMEFDRIMEKTNFEPIVLSKVLRHIKSEFYYVLENQIDSLKYLKNIKCYNCNLKEKHYELFRKKSKCKYDIELIEKNINVRSLDLYDDMELRLNVLKHFDFIDEDNNPTVKGKVASYVILTDEITLTQLIFENHLNNLEPAEIAAVLSCFVSPEKKLEESPDVTLNLQNMKQILTEIHSSFEVFYRKVRLKISSEEHWRLCNFKVMFLAYRWAEGASFAELLDQTQIEEGLIVRTILRLDELCRRVKVAFLYLGNIPLAEKIEKTSNMLRRDIIFTTSLYLK